MNRMKIRNPVARSPLLRKGGVHSIPKRHRLQEPRVQDAMLEWENEKTWQLPIVKRK